MTLIFLTSFAWVGLAAGTTAGFPEYDPEREVVLYGGRVGVPAFVRGTWHQKGGLRLRKRAAYGDENYWLPTHSAARFKDGMVRVRLRPGKQPRMHVLIRASKPSGAHSDELSGYGFGLLKDKVQFDRWDKGLMLPLGVSAPVVGLQNRSVLEVTLFAVGPLLVAMVHDGQTLEHLATLSVKDRRHPFGSVGLRANKRQNDQTIVDHLSVLSKGSTKPDLGAPFGPDLLVLLRKELRTKLPEDLKVKILEGAPVDSSQIALLLNRTQLARLRGAGWVPLSVTGDVPWWVRDRSYRLWRNKPIEETTSGFAIDKSYKNPVMVEGILKAYARRFPRQAKVVELGRSHQGRPILALKISDHVERQEREPALLVAAGHHGSELLSIEYALDTIQMLLERYDRDPMIKDFVNGFEIWCVPLVNPDGNHTFTEVNRWSGRKNSRDLDGDGVSSPWEGVDLNRNYPFRWGELGEIGSRGWPLHYWYRGPSAGSEPETKAMMRLHHQEHFVAAISYHTTSTAILSPYTIDHVENTDYDEAWPIAESMAKAAGVQASGRPYRVIRKLYSVDGVEQDWIRFHFGTLAYLIEGSHHNPLTPSVRRQAVHANRPAWTTLFQRILKGPGIHGSVRDEQGQPLFAEVRIEEQSYKQGERWMSRRRDGRFDRVVPGPGTYTLAVSSSGYRPFRRVVTVKEQPISLDVVLQRE